MANRPTPIGQPMADGPMANRSLLSRPPDISHLQTSHVLRAWWASSTSYKTPRLPSPSPHLVAAAGQWGVSQSHYAMGGSLGQGGSTWATSALIGPFHPETKHTYSFFHTDRAMAMSGTTPYLHGIANIEPYGQTPAKLI